MAQMNDKYDAKEEKKSLSQIQKFYRKKSGKYHYQLQNIILLGDQKKSILS